MERLLSYAPFSCSFGCSSLLFLLYVERVVKKIASKPMPVISAILIPWDMVAEHGLASIFLYVSRDISILSAICACVNPAIWRACFTE